MTCSTAPLTDRQRRRPGMRHESCMPLQALNLVFYIVANSSVVAVPCSWFSKLVAACGILQLTCWNTVGARQVASQCEASRPAQAHRVCLPWPEGCKYHRYASPPVSRDLITHLMLHADMMHCWMFLRPLPIILDIMKTN